MSDSHLEILLSPPIGSARRKKTVPFTFLAACLDRANPGTVRFSNETAPPDRVDASFITGRVSRVHIYHRGPSRASHHCFRTSSIAEHVLC